MQISCIVPTHNRPDRLKLALGSIQRQTMTVSEILVVDDSDEVFVEQNRAAAESFRATYIRNIDRPGACASRNRGILAARGTYLAFLDDDDQWVPDKLEKQLAQMQQYGADLSGTAAIYVHERRFKRTVSNQRPSLPEVVVLDSGQLFNGNLLGSTSTYLAKRDWATRILFDESLPALQDYDFMCRLVQAGGTALFVNRPMAKVDAHNGTRISTNTDKKRWGQKKFLLRYSMHMTRRQRRWLIFRIRLQSCYTVSRVTSSSVGLLMLCPPGRRRKGLSMVLKQCIKLLGVVRG